VYNKLYHFINRKGNNMYWEIEIPIIVRNLINDLEDPPIYSDLRIQQLAVVASQYVLNDVNLSKEYTIDIINGTITPDPSDPETRDTDFIGFIALKSSCILDQSTFRTKAALEGIKTSLGSANLTINGNLSGYKIILDQGPCKLYDQLILDYNIGNATAISAVLSPFVGNKFDPRYLLRGSFRGSNSSDFYS
jgi:hypothetical protein